MDTNLKLQSFETLFYFGLDGLHLVVSGLEVKRHCLVFQNGTPQRISWAGFYLGIKLGEN